ncbi:hypothetical protein Tco_0029226 [Tanacetum coccineum]
MQGGIRIEGDEITIYKKVTKFKITNQAEITQVAIEELEMDEGSDESVSSSCSGTIIFVSEESDEDIIVDPGWDDFSLEAAKLPRMEAHRLGKKTRRIILLYHDLHHASLRMGFPIQALMNLFRHLVQGL